MREHEVPTHVQAEDRVLLWFTFPQIVALTAVCALSYGAYRYAPVGPSEVRMAIAVLLGLAGIAAVVGKIGGRRLPLVAADLLKYRLGARLYAGPPSELVRSEPARAGPAGEERPRPPADDGEAGGKDPASPSPGAQGPGAEGRTNALPTAPLVRQAQANGQGQHQRNRQRGREPEVPANQAPEELPGTRGRRRSRGGGRHRPPVGLGRRPRAVAGRDRLRGDGAGRRAAALRRGTHRLRRPGRCHPASRHPLHIRVRAFGGPQGTWLRFWGSASLDQGEQIDYSLPLHGPRPSFTFSWEDTLGQAGAVTVEGEQIPYPLPNVEGELCDLRVTSLGWTSGVVEGVIESECVSTIEHPVELQTVAGHGSVPVTALMDAQVTAVTGTVAAATGSSHGSVPFVPGGETRFRLPVGAGMAVHPVSVDVSLEASLSIPIPPLTRLTHHPARVEQVTRTVHLHRPGDSDSDSETATATCEDGATASATATAYAYVPSATIAKEVTVDVLHKEHVKAETVERSPIAGSRDETLALASSVGADDPFEVLVLPEPEPVEPPAEQEPADGGPASSAGQALSDWFDLLGWEWPW